MSIAIDSIRWLVSIFNFIFALCGIGIIIPAVYFYHHMKIVPDSLQSEASNLLICAVIIGIIVFVIAFLGLCAAVKNGYYMAIIFATILFTILVVQVGIAIAVIITTHGFEEEGFDEIYQQEFDKYWTSDISREIIDIIQVVFSCCGINDSSDFSLSHTGMNGSYPMSCCVRMVDKSSPFCPEGWTFPVGCSMLVHDFLQSAGKTVGNIILVIAGVEIFGIMLFLVLANSIKNVHRRAFKA